MNLLPNTAWSVAALFPMVLMIFGSIALFRWYALLRIGPALGCWLLTLLAVGGCFIDAQPELSQSSGQVQDALIVATTAKAITLLLAVPFAIRLYQKWVCGHMTAEEQAGGKVGLRAWLSPGSVLLAVLISIATWKGFDLPFVLGLLLTVGALAAWPLFQQGGTQAEAPAAGLRFDDLSAERSKVLAMLEDGKITAEESADLLQALGATSQQPARNRTPISSSQRLVLIGASMLLVGFFLPWFVIETGPEVRRMLNEAQAAMNSFMPGIDVIEATGASTAVPVKHRIQISGGDLQRGLGWIVLLLGLAAAAAPFVARDFDPVTLRTLRLAALVVGAVIVLYLVTQSIGFIGIGLIIAILGYALELLGTIRDRRAA